MSDRGKEIAEDGAEAVRDYTQDVHSALSRPGENRAKQWFLLNGRRPVVTLVLLAFVFLVLVGLAAARPANMRNLLTETNSLRILFSSLLSGAILLVSIVVSINSIVLSQEITDIEAQQERTTASLEFRRQIEDSVHVDVTPARPAEFVRVVLFTILRQVNELKNVTAATSSDEFQQRVETLATKISEDVEQARAILGDARFGTFKVLLAGLNYDYSGQLHAARVLKRKYADELSEDEREAIDELVDSLVFFTTGREYFKSLYYKRELAELSARLLYVSLPVIVFISYVLLAVDAGQFPDAWLFDVSPLLVFVPLAYTVALAPYVVLTAYVIRAATISLRTLAAGPFILQKGSEIESLDFEDYEERSEWEREIAAED